MEYETRISVLVRHLEIACGTQIGRLRSYQAPSPITPSPALPRHATVIGCPGRTSSAKTAGPGLPAQPWPDALDCLGAKFQPGR
jgi:hypothetical protein